MLLLLHFTCVRMCVSVCVYICVVIGTHSCVYLRYYAPVFTFVDSKVDALYFLGGRAQVQ